MKNSYQQFFKEAQKAAGTAKKPSLPTAKKTVASPATAKKKIDKKKVQIPWKLSLVSFMGVVIAYFGVFHFDDVERYLSKIEFSVTTGAYAEAPPASKPEKSMAEKESSEVAAAAQKAEAEVEKKDFSEEELNHFARLNERKMELDKREEELNRVEAELAEQRAALEKRLSEIDENRRQISSILEEKVKKDETKIEALVQVYSNMKPSQAAKVIETLDEDLAVEVLGRMKKKNAADILNLIKSEKAQLISEKYAGFRK